MLYLVPPTAIAMAWLWLREPPAPLALGGGFLALAGVAITTRSRAGHAKAPELAPTTAE